MPDGIKAIIDGKPRDLGGFSVRRLLPQIGHHAVGPFVFMDHFGPVTMPPGTGMDVRPHPHIGLSTVTYLFEGEIEHRDSLGSVQVIKPGDVNWMTAGRGIVHSERSRPEWRRNGGQMHGIQLWCGLPASFEEVEPEFHHYPVSTLPNFTVGDAQVRLIAGSAYGMMSPAKTHSPLYYLEARLTAGGSVSVPTGADQTAVYLVTGSVTVGATALSAGQLAILETGRDCEIKATTDAHLLMLGGEALDAPRHMYWNFVSSSKERIEQAKADWASERFGSVPGDNERIPLP